MSAGAYGLYEGDTIAHDYFHDRILIFEDTLTRDFGHDPDLLRAQVTPHRPPRARPPSRLGRARRPRPRSVAAAGPMPEAVIVDAIRTPIGRAGKGSLRSVRADELAAIPIRELVARNPNVDFSQTDDVMMGAASGVGEQGYNVGRTAALLAGLDHHVPACTVNRFCASSLQTIRMAFHAIRAGEGEQYIAAGVEAVSRAGLGAGMTEDTRNRGLTVRPARSTTSTSRWG